MLLKSPRQENRRTNGPRNPRRRSRHSPIYRRGEEGAGAHVSSLFRRRRENTASKDEKHQLKLDVKVLVVVVVTAMTAEGRDHHNMQWVCLLPLPRVTVGEIIGSAAVQRVRGEKGNPFRFLREQSLIL
ncbi:unnamed protein product [Linum trigynum]|uniref:Uncharacterized protein n=1 Tax=Linum trigynum TaxID=586398 RepID=A0AAV2F6V5_9ROSI